MQQMTGDAWYAGFLAYCEGAQLDDMPTVAHKRGWWSALDAQVNATMPVSKRKVLTVEEALADTAEYEDDILDREYHARGNW